MATEHVNLPQAYQVGDVVYALGGRTLHIIACALVPAEPIEPGMRYTKMYTVYEVGIGAFQLPEEWIVKIDLDRKPRKVPGAELGEA